MDCCNMLQAARSSQSVCNYLCHSCLALELNLVSYRILYGKTSWSFLLICLPLKGGEGLQVGNCNTLGVESYLKLNYKNSR